MHPCIPAAAAVEHPGLSPVLRRAVRQCLDQVYLAAPDKLSAWALGLAGGEPPRESNADVILLAVAHFGFGDAEAGASLLKLLGAQVSGWHRGFLHGVAGDYPDPEEQRLAHAAAHGHVYELLHKLHATRFRDASGRPVRNVLGYVRLSAIRLVIKEIKADREHRSMCVLPDQEPPATFDSVREEIEREEMMRLLRSARDLAGPEDKELIRRIEDALSKETKRSYTQVTLDVFKSVYGTERASPEKRQFLDRMKRRKTQLLQRPAAHSRTRATRSQRHGWRGKPTMLRTRSWTARTVLLARRCWS